MLTKNHLIIAVAAVLLALFAVQLFIGARRQSATFDENIYITAGYTYVKTGEIKLNQESQPLPSYLFGVPLQFLNVKFPFDHPLWRAPYQGIYQFVFLQLFLYQDNPGKADTIIFSARTVTMFFSLLLAALVFLWAYELSGPRAALFALFLYVFCPNMLAHSGLATGDLFVTLFLFAAFYAFWKFDRTRQPGYVVLAGVSFGLALASKLSALVLAPAFVLIPLLRLIDERREGAATEAWNRRLLMYVLLLFAVAGIAINLLYGFSGTLEPKDALFTRAPETLTFSVLRPFSLFLPGKFTLALIRQLQHAGQGFNSFIFGTFSDTGFWYYFLAAFALKTPLPLLLFAALAAAYERSLRRTYFLVIPVLVFFFVVSFLNRINIGLRYLLPVYPLIFVYAGRLAALWEEKGPAGKTMLLALLMIWYAFGTLRVAPHYLAYFNELAGGPKNGHKILIDSNLDWGQDLTGLRNFVKKKNIPKIKLSYFGTSDPAYYGIPFDYLPTVPYVAWTWRYKDVSDNRTCPPANGIYAVSATNLQGEQLLDRDCFRWLRRYTPVAMIGYSILVYDVRDLPN